MKILFISSAKSIHTQKWVNALFARGYEVHLAYNKNDLTYDMNFSDGIIHHELPFSGTIGYFLNVFSLRKLYNEIKPNVVNAHFASGYGTLVNLSKIRPYILNVWGSDVYEFPEISMFHKMLVGNNLKNASLIASTSQVMAQRVKELLSSINSNKVHTIPFGVDIEKFKRINIKKDDRIVIGNIKSFKPIYGIEYLVKAIHHLKSMLLKSEHSSFFESLDVKIYGGGNTEEKQKIQMLIDSLDLSTTIKLYEPIPNSEVPSILEQFDIFCATSVQESFGVSLVEAMALELPVVATKVPGFVEVVENNKTGILVENKNPTSIANGLMELILNKEKRNSLGQNGREKVIKMYNFSDNVDSMIKLYDELHGKEIKNQVG